METYKRRHLLRVKQKGYEEGLNDGVSENMWVTTFSDMATLLLTFFVMLLAISVPDEAKFKEAMAFMQKALSLSVDETEVETLENKLKEFVELENLSNVVSVEYTTRGVMLSVAGDFTFASGEAKLTDENISFLNGIGELIRDLPNQIEISAHTDIVDISTEEFPSNWQLSAARASAIADYLVEELQIQGARLVPMGRAEFHPKYIPQDLPENMERNRRVEIEIIDKGL